MIQEILGLAVILFFILRLGWQYYKDQIAKSQFIFWLFFWFLGGLLVIFVKRLDDLALSLGFSSSGIQLLLYVAVVVMFYIIFRMRLKIARLEKDITELTRSVAVSLLKKDK